jgi:hypothetical protein
MESLWLTLFAIAIRLPLLISIDQLNGAAGETAHHLGLDISVAK